MGGSWFTADRDDVRLFPGQLNWRFGGAVEVAESYEDAAARQSAGTAPCREVRCEIACGRGCAASTVRETKGGSA